MSKIHIILDNIRSTHNVGSIFRTAETAGVLCIYCLGTTPAPVDRFGRARSDIAKVALGAEKLVDWEYVEDLGASKLITRLKKERFKIVAVEQHEGSVDYREVGMKGNGGKKGGEKSKAGKKSKTCEKNKATKESNVAKNLVFIFGNEVSGVSKKLLKVADVIAEIPMKGVKESLNVSVAVGVVLFRV